MSKLKCVDHGKRVMVIEDVALSSQVPDPYFTFHTCLHRSTGERCDTWFVEINGHLYDVEDLHPGRHI